MGSYAFGQTADRKDELMSETNTCKRTLLCSSPIDRKNHAVQRLIFPFRKLIMNKSTPNSCSPQGVTPGKLVHNEVDFHRCPTGQYDLSWSDPGFERRTLGYPSVNPCLKREKRQNEREREDVYRTVLPRPGHNSSRFSREWTRPVSLLSNRDRSLSFRFESSANQQVSISFSQHFLSHSDATYRWFAPYVIVWDSFVFFLFRSTRSASWKRSLMGGWVWLRMFG